MLKTTYAGKELIHRHLWQIVEREARIAAERDQDWFQPSLVAMVFAFHTVEAYLNYLGELLAPQIWQDERNFFRREPFRGWDGKLRKVMELVGFAWLPWDQRQQTLLNLKELRDLIGHGKSEKLEGENIHGDDDVSPPPVSTLLSLVIPKERLTHVLHDVETLLDEFHNLAAADVHDLWFGSRALRGPLTYTAGKTTKA